MKKEKKIVPRTPAGFKDYLPKDMIPRQKMFDTIRSVFELYGFVPLDGPCVEQEEILTGGDPDFKMNIYSAIQLQDFKKLENLEKDGLRDKEKDRIFGDAKALRFDLTVQLARILAQYPELSLPFKRYQIGKVWRGETPQAGRYREFMQFDVDIAGSDSMMADAEIIAIMSAVMKALKIENFIVKVNNRKILNGLSESVGFDSELTPTVLRILDKLDKIQMEGVESELSDVGLKDNQIKLIRKFIEITGSNSDMLIQASELMKKSQTATEGISELQEISKNLESLGIEESAWKVDFSVARGLGYYTGPVFETVLTNLPEDFSVKGSVFSGGRYDGLVEKFSDKSIPATGAAVGVDRLFAALQELNKIPQEKTVTKVMILNFDPEAKFYIQEIAGMFRNSNISTEVYLGKESKLRDQLGFAKTSEIPFVIIAGGEEVNNNTVQIKYMNEGKQETVDKSQIVDKIKSAIKIS